MNLEKRIRIAIFLILILPAGCAQTRPLKVPVNNFNPGEEVIQTLWSEGIRITKANPDRPPNIFYESRQEKSSPQSPEDCSKYKEKEKNEQCQKDNEASAKPPLFLGLAYLDNSYKIRIFCDTILDNFYNKALWPTYKFQLLYTLGLTAHEMLHQLYWKMGVPVSDHHKKMKESGDLARLLDYLSDKQGVRRENVSKKLSMESLDYGIELDEICKRRAEREKSLIKN